MVEIKEMLKETGPNFERSTFNTIKYSLKLN